MPILVFLEFPHWVSLAASVTRWICLLTSEAGDWWMKGDGVPVRSFATAVAVAVAADED